MPGSRDRYMGAAITVAIICCIAALMILYWGSPDLAGGEKPENLTLSGDGTEYSPRTSSAPGIRLQPDYSADYFSLRYHWKTNYGFFLDWNRPEYIVIPLGDDVITDSRTLYWTYNMSDTGREKPAVTVTVTLEDEHSGNALDEASLDIIWLDTDTARVKNPDQMIENE